MTESKFFGYMSGGGDLPLPDGPPAAPEVDPDTAAALERQKAEARRRLWYAGNLVWKFRERPWARELYDFIHQKFGEMVFARIHRRGAKTSTGGIITLETCLQVPNTSCAIVCGTKEQMRPIFDEIMGPILVDCPKKLIPRKIKSEYRYQFDHNGSYIDVLAAEGLAGRRARGRRFRFIHVTEAGFIDKIDEVLRNVLLPTIRDPISSVPTGTCYVESTPPEEPDHPFNRLWAEAELDARTFFLPLSKNRWATQQFIDACIKDCGGRDSVAFRREYELEDAVDSETTVIPEFTQERAFGGAPADSAATGGDGRLYEWRAGTWWAGSERIEPGKWGELHLPEVLPPIVRELADVPAGSDRYSSLDTGGRDLTANLIGRYWFEQDLLYIENELALLNMTTDILATKMRAMERETWGDAPRGKLVRVADPQNVIILYDLLKKHQLSFRATQRDNKDAQINAVRLMTKAGRIVIHPRCTRLVKTLRLARRAKQMSKGFERMEEIGHADLLDCLIYMVRNLKRRELPAEVKERAATSGIVREVRAERPPMRNAHLLAKLLGGG